MIFEKAEQSLRTVTLSNYRAQHLFKVPAKPR